MRCGCERGGVHYRKGFGGLGREREGDEEGEDGVDASSITIISIFR